jgi:hypothetical protein
MKKELNTEMPMYEVPFSFVAMGILMLSIFFTALTLLWV